MLVAAATSKIEDGYACTSNADCTNECCFEEVCKDVSYCSLHTTLVENSNLYYCKYDQHCDSKAWHCCFEGECKPSPLCWGLYDAPSLGIMLVALVIAVVLLVLGLIAAKVCFNLRNKRPKQKREEEYYDESYYEEEEEEEEMSDPEDQEPQAPNDQFVKREDSDTGYQMAKRGQIIFDDPRNIGNEPVKPTAPVIPVTPIDRVQSETNQAESVFSSRIAARS